MPSRGYYVFTLTRSQRFHLSGPVVPMSVSLSRANMDSSVGRAERASPLYPCCRGGITWTQVVLSSPVLQSFLRQSRLGAGIWPFVRPSVRLLSILRTRYLKEKLLNCLCCKSTQVVYHGARWGKYQLWGLGC